jgi:hypothetical protein
VFGRFSDRERASSELLVLRIVFGLVGSLQAVRLRRACVPLGGGIEELEDLLIIDTD